jgi:hypothetical protein
MTNVFILIAALFFIGFVIRRLGRKSSSTRYERKPKTPWNSLSEGEDPTV